MECHFFFQERWGMSVFPFPIQTTYSMASKMNGPGSFLRRREETEKEKEDPSSFCPLPASMASRGCLPHHPVLNSLSPGPLQQLTGGTAPSLTCVWSLCHTEKKSQVTLSIPVFPGNTEHQTWKVCSQAFLHVLGPRSYFLQNCLTWPTSLKCISLQMKVMSSKCQLGWRMNYVCPPSLGQKFCLFLKVSGIEVLQKPRI